MNSGVTEIIEPGESGHSLSVEGLPPGALKAIINKLNEKSQSATRIFEDNYNISVDDVKQLIEKIQQEFTGRECISISAQLSLHLSKGERIDFRSWIEFKDFDSARKEQTNSLSLEMVVDVVNAETQLPERYHCQISIQNDPRRFGFVMGPISFVRANSAGVPPVPISATVKYNNYIVGKNLISLVDDWVEALEKRERTSVQRLQKYTRRISQTILYASTIAGFILILQEPWRHFGMVGISNSQAIGIAGLICSTSFFVGFIVGNKIETLIDRQQEFSNIIITQGDRNREKKVQDRNWKSTKKALGFGALIAVEVIASILATPILKALGWAQ